MYRNVLYKPFLQTKIIYHFVNHVFPIVKRELSYWENYAAKIPDKTLSKQAVASIQSKSFHAQGGSIYGLYYYKINPDLIQFIVSLQTISDYLDNLCDRVGIENEKAFLQLHLAITDALRPDNQFADYYAYYPYKDDAGYLYALVKTCKRYIQTLPGYPFVQRETIYLGKLYSEMQSYKHIVLSKRESAMCSWAYPYLQVYKDISIWEFSAAAGSTLGVFLLCALAENEKLTKQEVRKAMEAYFPWLCGLHILLDYYIDEREDQKTGDLNFVSFYVDEAQKKERLIWFLKQSAKKVSQLSNPLFHITVIEGLLAMYLSDPKAACEIEKIIRTSLLKNASYAAHVFYGICKLLRKKKTII